MCVCDGLCVGVWAIKGEQMQDAIDMGEMEIYWVYLSESDFFHMC